MKAIAVIPGTRTLRLVDRPEPSIAESDEIKLRVLRVGICGTDREEAAGGRAKAPPSREDIVLGHEMLGQVVDVGRAVTLVTPGDYALFTVRRGCGRCRSCAMNRSDMCQTGVYSERGIWALDGYQTEYVVDREQDPVRVTPNVAAVGVLAEPFSIVEKAISEAVHLQLTRLPDSGTSLDLLSGKRCLVAGLGPVGLLAALSLRLRGAEVWGLDVVDAATPRPAWLGLIGGRYLDGRQIAITSDRNVRLNPRGHRNRQPRVRSSRRIGDKRRLRDHRYPVGQSATDAIWRGVHATPRLAQSGNGGGH